MASKTRALERKKLDLLTHEISVRKGRVGKGLFEIGIRLARVQDGDLWESGGYATFDEYLSSAVGLSRTVGYRLLRIARQFNAAIAERYGVDKLDAAISYLAATPPDEQPGDILAADIRLRGDRGRFVNVPFHDATAIEVREATALLNEAKRGRHRVPRDLRDDARALNKAMPSAPPGLSRGERVRLRRGNDGRLAVSFAAIPVDELDGFVRALKKHMMS